MEDYLIAKNVYKKIYKSVLFNIECLTLIFLNDMFEVIFCLTFKSSKKYG